MKKLFVRILSTMLLCVFVFQLTVTNSLAVEQKDSNEPNNDPQIQSVDVKDTDYLNQLMQKNEMVKTKVNDLEKEGMVLEEKVATILLNDERSDVLYYHNEDESIIGMVQFIENYKTELRVFLNEDRETISKSIFTKVDGTKEVLNVVNGEVIPEYNTGVTTLGLTPHQCNLLVSLAGTGIGTIYGLAANAILGPAGAAVVALIQTYGWTYVTDQCSA